MSQKELVRPFAFVLLKKAKVEIWLLFFIRHIHKGWTCNFMASISQTIRLTYTNSTMIFYFYYSFDIVGTSESQKGPNLENLASGKYISANLPFSNRLNKSFFEGRRSNDWIFHEKEAKKVRKKMFYSIIQNIFYWRIATS